MYVLLKADEGILDSDCKVKLFTEHVDAFNEMIAQVQAELIDNNSFFEYDEDGLFSPTSSNDHYEIDEDYAFVSLGLGTEWRIYETNNDVHSPDTSHENNSVAETVNYECANDPRFSSGEVLLHQATMRWNSGKSFKVHAPKSVELRVGGTLYEYSIVKE